MFPVRPLNTVSITQTWYHLPVPTRPGLQNTTIKKKVRETIVSALAYWVENDFICDNWWYNQIGTPGSMVSLMLIIGDELPAGLVEKTQPIIGRAHINASGARPGGHRMTIAGIQAKNLLFLNEYEQFEEVIRVIESEIKFRPGSEGYMDILSVSTEAG